MGARTGVASRLLMGLAVVSFALALMHGLSHLARPTPATGESASAHGDQSSGKPAEARRLASPSGHASPQLDMGRIRAYAEDLDPELFRSSGAAQGFKRMGGVTNPCWEDAAKVKRCPRAINLGILGFFEQSPPS